MASANTQAPATAKKSQFGIIIMLLLTAIIVPLNLVLGFMLGRLYDADSAYVENHRSRTTCC